MSTLGLVLLIILVLLLLGAAPLWPYNRGSGTMGSAGYSAGWGWGPGGIVGVLLIIVIVLLLTNRL